MWIDRLTFSRTTHAVALAAQFCEQRQRVLAENLANVDTPNHVSRYLDPVAFQASLQQALADSAPPQSPRRLELRGNAQFATGPDGRVRVRPATRPAQNVLFHDGTNVRLEGLLADIADNATSYELATGLLRTRFEGLLQAIRGRLR